MLKNLRLIDCLNDNASNATSKAPSNTVSSADVYNVKSYLMRLIANLVYKHSGNQHTVKLTVADIG